MRSALALPRTSFLGREGALAHLAEQFAAGAWLVTLVGPAGIGKTRLAVRYGEVAERHLGHSVPLCDLSEARDLDAVAAAVGRALSLAHADVGGALADRGRALVLLDNCEQALEAVAAAIAAWRVQAPGTLFLCTSRERLRVAGEQLYEVAPLSLPDARGMDSSEAAALFVERTRMVRPGYEPLGRAREIVGAIVRHLDGFPLAIELAAARMGALDEADLLERLDRGLALLTQGPRDQPPRQRTLERAIEWSWRLLDPWQQAALAQCSVFSGGFTMEAAERVIDLAAFPGAPPTVEVVLALHDKSLVRAYAAPSGAHRLGLYETIRSYAAGMLRATGGEEASRVRHATEMLGLMEPLAATFDQHGSAEILALLGDEVDNLLAIHQWTSARGAAGLRDALRALEVLAVYFTLRGPAGRFLSMLDATLALPFAEPLAPARARVLVARGQARRVRGLAAGAHADLEEALATARRHGDRVTEGRALGLLARLEWKAGNPAAAEQMLEGVIAIFRERGERLLHARAQAELAEVLVGSERVGRSRPLFQEALRVFGEIGSVHDEALCRQDLAWLDHREGRLAEAMAGYQEALSLDRRLGAQRRLACTLSFMGLVHQEEEHPDMARECYVEALAKLRLFDDEHTLGMCLRNLGGLEHELGRRDEAQRLYLEAESTLRRAGRSSLAALVLAARGALEGAEGRLSLAEQMLDAAEAALGAVEEKFFHSAVELYRGHLDLARSHAAEAAGDHVSAQAARAEAEGRLAEAERYCARSDEVRLARRLLVLRLASPPPREPPPAEDPDAVVVHPSGRWFQVPGGARVDLSRRDSLRLILEALVQHRLNRVEEPLTVEDLVRCGWPGQRLIPSAGAARVNTAMGTLRKMGLREAIGGGRGRYCLSPSIRLVVAQAPRPVGGSR